jgi:hypothetical protein
VAPVGTVAVIWLSESTVKLGAVVALNRTCVAPQRLVPVMTTLVPTGPLVGANELTVAGPGAVASKMSMLAVSGLGVLTLIGPSSVLHGTTAVALVSLRNVHVTAASGPAPASKSTPVMPVNPVPVMVTNVPGGPLIGLNDVTVEADAGRADMSTATRASASVDAIVRAVFLFLGNLMGDSLPVRAWPLPLPFFAHHRGRRVRRTGRSGTARRYRQASGRPSADRTVRVRTG